MGDESHISDCRGARKQHSPQHIDYITFRPKRKAFFYNKTRARAKEFAPGRIFFLRREYFFHPDRLIGERISAEDGLYEKAACPCLPRNGPSERFRPRGGRADTETTLWPAYDPETGLWGYIDEQGAWGIAPQWETALDFRNGYAIVDMGEDAEGLIDETGAYIFQPVYDLIDLGTIGPDSWVYNDVYLIYDNSLCGWFDTESGYISGLCWEHVESWDDSPYVIAGVAGMETFVCRDSGKRLLPLTDMSTYGFHEGYALCIVDGGRDFIVDLAGNIAHLPEGLLPDDVYLSDGLLLVEDANGLHGYVDAAGNVVIAPQYDDGGLFQDGYAVVEKDGENLLINRENRVIATGWHNVCGPWADDGIAVEGDDCWAVLNPDGTERFRVAVEPYEYAKGVITCPPLVEGGPWWVGYWYGGVGTDYGLMTADGAWLVDADDGMHSFSLADDMFSDDPLGWHAAWCDGKWGFIDGAGNTVLPFIYEDAGHFDGALACVMLDASTEAYINRSGGIVYRWTVQAAR